jgi:MinD superfamily P-loop ATPase
MKTLTVVSGKGGTGKTSIVGSFAALTKNSVFADCDVDAADLSLIMDAQLKDSRDFIASQKAQIDVGKCIQCNICAEICHFDAIRAYRVDRLSCEGCGVCSLVCPKQAITMEEVLSGHLFVSGTPYGPLVHAQLEPGEANSGKLVTLVRQTAEKIAQETKREFIIIDGAPGIGCPVIASITGATAALIVTEPTLSGIRDLTRVLSVCQHFNVPTFVCINRYDLHEGNTGHIEKFCQEKGTELVGKIPCDLNVTHALAYQIPVVRYADSKAPQQIKMLWNRLTEQAQL